MTGSLQFLCNISMQTSKPSSPLRNKGLSQSFQLLLGARPASAAECHPQPPKNQAVSGSQTSKQIQDWTPTNWGRSQQAHILDPSVSNTPKPVSSWWLTLPSSSPSLSLKENDQHLDHTVKSSHLPLKAEGLRAHLLAQLRTAHYFTKLHIFICLFA